MNTINPANFTREEASAIITNLSDYHHIPVLTYDDNELFDMFIANLGLNHLMDVTASEDVLDDLRTAADAEITANHLLEDFDEGLIERLWSDSPHLWQDPDKPFWENRKVKLCYTLEGVEVEEEKELLSVYRNGSLVPAGATGARAHFFSV